MLHHVVFDATEAICWFSMQCIALHFSLGHYEFFLVWRNHRRERQTVKLLFARPLVSHSNLRRCEDSCLRPVSQIIMCLGAKISFLPPKEPIFPVQMNVLWSSSNFHFVVDHKQATEFIRVLAWSPNNTIYLFSLSLRTAGSHVRVFGWRTLVGSSLVAFGVHQFCLTYADRQGSELFIFL